jgi:pyruvate-ferredoxin/flavodoxin oxidoreductase
MPPPPFPGVLATDDGTGAVVWVETNISQAACAYPITPSTNMGVQYAQAAANGLKNLWGEPLRFLEAESEHSSASAAEGFALAGGRVTNFTSGQGLILMKEVLYVISGKRLAVVFNIGARALTSQALNVHAGHDDVMGVADTGWGMLFARNAQEAADLCLISRRTAEATETPFMNVQDGFLTTHTVETLRLPEEDLMREYIGLPEQRLRPLFDPQRGIMSGVVQNQEAYMRGKIAQRYYYDQLHKALEVAMEEYHGLTGRHYGLVNGYRMADADYALVALGSTAETAEAVVDYLREQRGLRVGVVHPTAFRPFPGPQLVEMLKNVTALAVIERMDNPTGQSNPLTAEIKAAFCDALLGQPAYPKIHRIPEILSGSAGLGSRNIRPGDLIAVVEAMLAGRREFFSLNVDHPSALVPSEAPDIRPEGAFSMRGYSIGGYGSVTTNKVIATVCADLFGLNVQAYPLYGSEKKGLPTNYYLTLAPEPIRTHCEMEHAEFVPLNNINALQLGNPFQNLSRGGIAFVQWASDDPEALWEQVPIDARRSLREAQARVFYLDAARIAREETPRPELEIRMQGIVLLGVFLRVAPFREKLQVDDATLVARAEEALRHQFGRLSEEVVAANLRCVERGFGEVQELPQTLILESAGVEEARYEGRTVGDLMHHGVITCSPDQPLGEVVRTLETEHISAIVVTDGNGEMEGILSTTDLSRAVLSPVERMELPSLLPRHLMTSEVIVTWPGEPLKDAVEKMLSSHVHRLVVTPEQGDRRHPIGILSVTDLAIASGEFVPPRADQAAGQQP